MYNAYFNLQERPFKLVPDPEYLYLSKSHEIALAHLNYAMDQGDGFVVVVGEVGTGKTTLCRLFLNRLDDKTESAYIFNPNLDCGELLASICSEFGIQTQINGVKALLDVLNDYLILKHKMGRKVLLLIDEAQNLTVENLEMIRMLSNLETTRQKLLQIILVGQPELNDRLDSYELRQLSQRISLGCCLSPLSAKETEKYINHRLSIASQRPQELFTSAACRQIHRYANGIPRLINIAADRALLSAYSLNRKRVTRAIAQTAIQEISHRGSALPRIHLWGRIGWGVLAFLICIAVGWGLGHSQWVQDLVHSARIRSDVQSPAETPGTEPPSYKIPTQPNVSVPRPAVPAEIPIDAGPDDANQAKSLPPADRTLEGKAAAETLSPMPAALEAAQAAPNQGEPAIGDRIAELDHLNSRAQAVATLLQLWQQPASHEMPIPQAYDDQRYFEIGARQYGLRLYTIVDDWTLVEKLNMPAIVALKGNPPDQTVYMVLSGRQGDRLSFSAGREFSPLETTIQAATPYLRGSVYVYWNNIFGFDAVIANGAHETAISALKSILREVGFSVPDSPEFDQATRTAVLAFQKKHGIDTDGLAGPLTKMLLILDTNKYQIPRLTLETGAGR